ncbi:alpha-tocopherol transfer protein-like [Musca vetustissima]|uniref:alpha-tocopherol transfer protein-like n=1 Tax=Musca vetustissima TaxID=27455 RepID=UPI002AB6554C|nr:alpha-tocopherol transfer protein-like [Musca vetustissima]
MEIKGDTDQEQIIDNLQKWFEDNTKLPNKIDRLVLTRFYFCMNKNVEETKELLEINYSLRNKYPELFIKRDPEDEDTRNTYAFTYMVPLPGLTHRNYRVTYVRFKNPDPKMMHFSQDAKTLLMIGDCRFTMPDAVINDIPVVADGDILVMDMEGYRMQHVAGVSLRTLRIFLKFLQQAYSVRIKGLHFINCPSYLNKIMAVVKPFISKEVYDMMHFHVTGLDTLYAHVPRDILPEECGGLAGKIEDLSDLFYKQLLSKRDYLMDPKYWVIEKQ